MAVAPAALFALPGTDPVQFATHLSTTYFAAAVTPWQSWSVSHNLYRSGPSPSAQPNTTSNASFLHLLQLSNHSEKTFFCTTSENAPAHSIVIPQGSATSDFRKLLDGKLGPIWQPVRQGEVHVANGVTWDVGMFRVQAADLMRDRGREGGSEKRGTAVLVSFANQEGGENDGGLDSVEAGTELLREFCTGLGLIGPQKSVQTLAEVWGELSGWQGETDLWCQFLKMLVFSGQAQRAR